MRVIAMLPNGRGGLYRGAVTIDSGRITRVAPHPSARVCQDGDIDFSPCVALPGFIDLQLNGAFGNDVTTDPTTLWHIGERLPEQGVTAFLPTVISSSSQQRRAAYAAIRARPVAFRGAAPLGLHIEGPALSPKRSGTHSPAHLMEDGGALSDEVVAEANAVSLVTIAPESVNAVRAVQQMVAAGITVSLGHTAASAAETERALDAGARAFTHLFNGMEPLHHREIGVVGAALLSPHALVSLIVDGRHLSDEIVKLVWRLVGPARICLITDAMAGMGAAPGTYRLGDVKVDCTESALNASGGLAGSLLTMHDAARRLRDITAASWDDIATVTSANPAALVDHGDRGRLEAGTRADITVVDAALRPVATIVGGDVVYRSVEPVAVAGPKMKVPQAAGAETGPVLTHQTVKQVTIGVDIGGTTFKAAAFDGAALGAVRRGATGAARPAHEVLADVRAAIEALAGAEGAEAAGVGIACPGIVDATSGTVVEAGNLGWRDIDVAAGLGLDITLPVTVEHDVYLAAMAEWETGAGVGADSMLYVSVGTGVASRLFTSVGTERGSTRLAGEMGFIAVGPDQLPLERVASGRALTAVYQAETGRMLPASEIFAAADSDEVAARLTAAAVGALAQGVASAVCLQDPQIVVMGGGVSAASPAMIDALALRVAELLEPLRDPPPFMIAAHGDSSGIVGAALHASRVLAAPGGRRRQAGK